jgi:hypothetical protein
MSSRRQKSLLVQNLLDKLRHKQRWTLFLLGRFEKATLDF